MASGSRWNLWVWLAGGGCALNLSVVSGCGCKEVYTVLSVIYAVILFMRIMRVVVRAHK